MSFAHTPGVGGALVVVLGLAAGMATRLAVARGRPAPLRRASLYLLLGAALLLLLRAPEAVLDAEDRRLTVLVTALIAGGMLASDAGALLRRFSGRR